MHQKYHGKFCKESRQTINTNKFKLIFFKNCPKETKLKISNKLRTKYSNNLGNILSPYKDQTHNTTSSLWTI